MRSSTQSAWFRLIAMAVAGALAWAACGSPEAADEGPDGAIQTDRFGLIVLTHETQRSDGRAGDRMSARGWFVEGVGLDAAEVTDFLGVSETSRVADPTFGACELREQVSSDGLPASEMEGRALYFMDAGEVSVAAGRAKMHLHSGYFPDVHPDVGGLVYDGQHWPGRALMRRGAVLVEGAGSPEVGPFAVQVTPPRVMRLHEVGGVRLRSARIRPGYSNDGLSVTWYAGPFDGEVVLEVVRRGFDREASVRCVVADAGHFVIPQAAIDQLPDYGADQTDHLEVHRSSRASFEAEGVSRANVVMVAKDTVILETP